MVVGPKISIQRMDSKGRMSILRLQHLTVKKKRSILSISYGFLLVIISITMAAINPLDLVTKKVMYMEEGSFLFKMWETPPYEILTDVWIYNFTNVPAYLSGEDKVLRVQEVGPFTYREIRTNEDMTINEETGRMRMKPKQRLEFVKELSLSNENETWIQVPNIPLIALSTLAADRFGYSGNTIAYYSMSAMGSKLFKNLTVEQFLWGYHDPLVATANGLLPGWIDFGRLGILDRIYASKGDVAEVEIRNESNKYSIQSWNDSPGIAEQGFKDLNTSTPCNRLKNAYEGIMLTPNYPKGKPIPIYRRQACRVYPFNYEREMSDGYGFNYYRYKIADTAFSRSSEYACNCSGNCLPEGFVDISKCYYGFPITLSKIHYGDVDPVQKSYYEGMDPTPADVSFIHLEPTLGIPLAISIKIQVNIAVRMSAGNTLTKPLKDKVVPLIWLNIYTKEPPSHIKTLLKLRLQIGPPSLIIIEVLLFIGGSILIIQALCRIYKPRYKVVPPKDVEMKRRRSTERRTSSILMNVIENKAFKRDQEYQKQTVSLLDTCDDELDTPDLIVSD